MYSAVVSTQSTWDATIGFCLNRCSDLIMSDTESKNAKHEIVDKVIRTIPDFPKKGIMFKDITPLIGNHEAFKYVIDHLVARYKGRDITHVVGIESRGFMFAAPIALEIGAGFVPARKPNKLPFDKISQKFSLEYGEDELQMHTDAIPKGAKVVVMDDLIATGGTLLAACQLVTQLGAEVVEAACVIGLPFLGGSTRLQKGGITAPVYTMIDY
eukprot:NODE_408_length_866_cov_441.837618_g399_i0.p1 GENE.NODE_408_length_866_cov_441.837618_g399_i0~~NODE_408_length_866_cov_441.837618_g399_i0.p1  ORF type:complete len:213 (-),score=70.50 NODE_408_length_866_cov_441.837618_g399_i0:228-866(-)